jgi:hypothetical protein
MSLLKTTWFPFLFNRKCWNPSANSKYYFMFTRCNIYGPQSSIIAKYLPKFHIHHRQLSTYFFYHTGAKNIFNKKIQKTEKPTNKQKCLWLTFCPLTILLSWNRDFAENTKIENYNYFLRSLCFVLNDFIFIPCWFIVS